MGATKSNVMYGRKTPNTGKRYSDSFLGFVDINLSDRNRDELLEWVIPGKLDVALVLAQLLEEGYKFSLAADVEHHSVIATVTGKAPACANCGYALSGRGPNAYEAIVVLWYKVAVLANWGPWVQPDATGGQQMPLWR